MLFHIAFKAEERERKIDRNQVKINNYDTMCSLICTFNWDEQRR